MTPSREIRLAARPHGVPTPDDFELATVELPDPGPGELLVRNRWMSVDPYMRGRMNDAKSYAAPFAVGAPLDGAALGEVVAGEGTGTRVGDRVVHGLGWREHAIVPADRVLRIDPTQAPEQAHLGVLGMPGRTAYVGLRRILELREGDVLFVSGAAGAVGSAAGQIARRLGASRVLGSAGGPDKVRHAVEDLGFDACLDHRTDRPVREQLAEAAPDGIDAYFDNVGGDHLEAAIGALRTDGRIAICGAISQYNATEAPAGVRNLVRLIQTRGRIQGFLVNDHPDLVEEFVDRASGWIADGSLRYRETIRDGLDAAPQAFIDLLAGANTGKMLVRLVDDA